MNKIKLHILIVLMVISLLGIIFLQALWISQAIKTERAKFNKLFISALNETVHQAEKHSDVEILESFFDTISVKTFDVGANDSLLEKIVVKKNPFNVKVQHTDSLHQIISMSNTDTLLGISNTNMDVVFNGDLASQNVFVYTTSDSLMSTKTKVYKRIESKRKALQDRTVELTWEILQHETQRTFDILELEGYFKSALSDYSIDIPFYLGIIEEDSLVVKSNGADDEVLRNSDFKVRMFPNDIFQKPVFLIAHTKAYKKFTMQLIWWILLLSMVFTLLIIFTFIYSVHLILKQKRISDMKSDFMNNMTHELKTPIASISVAADSIMNDKVIGDRQRLGFFTGTIKSENNRMLRHIEDILQYARLDKHEVQFKYEPVNVKDLLVEATAGFELIIQEQEGKLSIQGEPNNPFISADRSQLMVVFRNIIDNAIKYSPEKPVVLVSLASVKSGIQIKIADEGIGMNQKTLAHIFEPFYRQQTGNVHNVKGFGLGLSHAYRIVEAHGGIIKAKSEVGKGSEITIELPYSQD